MTDKESNFAKDINVPHKEQMIINGIDASGCEFYNKDDKTCREENLKVMTKSEHNKYHQSQKKRGKDGKFEI